VDIQQGKFEELLQKFAEDVHEVYGELEQQEIENAVRDAIEGLLNPAT
jgi:hypothetical protein